MVTRQVLLKCEGGARRGSGSRQDFRAYEIGTRLRFVPLRTLQDCPFHLLIPSGATPDGQPGMGDQLALAGSVGLNLAPPALPCIGRILDGGRVLRPRGTDACRECT